MNGEPCMYGATDCWSCGIYNPDPEAEAEPDDEEKEDE